MVSGQTVSAECYGGPLPFYTGRLDPGMPQNRLRSLNHGVPNLKIKNGFDYTARRGTFPRMH